MRNTKFDSLFRELVVVSQRAEQLIRGAQPRLDSTHIKPTLVAKDELDAELVPWREISREEADAQREAELQQLRAEFDASAESPVRDVLPTKATEETPEPVAAVEEGEAHDPELERLQKLFGLGGAAPADDSSEASDDKGRRGFHRRARGAGAQLGRRQLRRHRRVGGWPAMRPRAVLRYLEDLGWQLPQLPSPAQQATASDSRTPATAERADLEGIADAVNACSACRLHESRKHTVPGEGASNPAVLFVGEAPGAREDATGRPFVGEAGQLLEAMLDAVELNRQQVFITNVVKCRPPGNRNPTESEMTACRSFLDRQIELLEPSIIVCLGKVPAHWLLGSTKSMRALRGRWYTYRTIPVLAMYHPAYLLRSPQEKRAAWEDLKMLRSRLRGS